MTEISTEIGMMGCRKGIQIEPNRHKLSPEDFAARREFWKYCQRAANAAQVRAKKFSVPFDGITAGYIDELFMAQDWSCAITRIAFTAPTSAKQPFQPSLDRIVPMRGYVRGNVRLVCLIVNYAINKWGDRVLVKLIEGIRQGFVE